MGNEMGTHLEKLAYSVKSVASRHKLYRILLWCGHIHSPSIIAIELTSICRSQFFFRYSKAN